MQQRSEEWYSARVGRITASRVGAILGLSKYRNADDVLRDMVREHHGAEPEFTGNDATRYGQEHEPDAVAAYEAETGAMVEDAPLCIHAVHDWLAASPDGFVGSDGGIECKCPYRAKYTEASGEYQAQMQLQMACAGLDWVDFVIWRDGEDVIIKRYACDPGWLQNNFDILEQFHEQYLATINSKELSAPHLESKERDDSAWRAGVADLRNAREYLADAKAAEKAALQYLQNLAPNGAKGCGLSLTKVERAGSISYSKAIKDLLPDADLEPYRGKPSIYYKATFEGE